MTWRTQQRAKQIVAVLIGVLGLTGCAPSTNTSDGGSCLTDEQQQAIENYNEYIHPAQVNTPVMTDQMQLNLSFAATPWPPAQGPVTFTVTLKNVSDGSPLTGAFVEAQVWNPNGQDVMAQTNAPEMGDGVYQITGVNFTQSGNWLVKFHIQVVDAQGNLKLHNFMKFAFIVP